MSCFEYTTVNNNTLVFVPMSSVSHIIEGDNDKDREKGKTCWIQFLNGKSIHVATPYDEVVIDLGNHFNSLR